MSWRGLFATLLAGLALAVPASSASAVTVTPAGPITLTGGGGDLTASGSGTIFACTALSGSGAVGAAGGLSGSITLSPCQVLLYGFIPFGTATVTCPFNGSVVSAGPPATATMSVSCTLEWTFGCTITISGSLGFTYDAGTLTQTYVGSSLAIPQQHGNCGGNHVGGATLELEPIVVSPAFSVA